MAILSVVPMAVTLLPPANIPSAFLREGFSEITGDDNGWGWTLGLMYQPGPSTTLGFSYRSKIELELEGEAELSNVPQATGGIPPLTYTTLEEDARLPLDLPESGKQGFKQGFGEQWTLHGGATWTRWSRFENLDIFTDQEGGGPISQLGGAKYQQAGIITHVPERWENTLALAIGVTYACTPEFTIKAGYAFDESPIQKEFRTARIPSLMSNLQDMELVAVARAFSQFLNYANIAEQHHRVRRRRAYQHDTNTPPQPGSLAELLPRLKTAGIPPRQIYDTVVNLSIELVLTAHPTEVTRRTLLRKHKDIDHILSMLDRPDLTPTERESQLGRLRRRIIASWHTDEIRRHKPTPIDEAKWGFATIESILWRALPEYMRLLDQQLQQYTGQRLPLDAAPLRFASWMGGDRDGNPNVTAENTGRRRHWTKPAGATLCT